MRIPATLTLVLALVAFVGASLFAIGAHAADAATATTSYVLPWGDIYTFLIALCGGAGTIAAIVAKLILMELARINKPLAAAAEAAGADQMIEASIDYALGTTEGEAKGKTIQLDNLPAVMARSLNFATEHGPDVINFLGGTDKLKDRIVAKLSSLALLPPETSTTSFTS